MNFLGYLEINLLAKSKSMSDQRFLQSLDCECKIKYHDTDNNDSRWPPLLPADWLVFQ